MPQIDISGSDSKISADKIQGQSGTTVTVQSGHSLSGDGSGLTSLNGSNISSGTVADARISALTASKLTGALPAISGASLTNLPSSLSVASTDGQYDASTTGTITVSGLSFAPKALWCLYNVGSSGNASWGWAVNNANNTHHVLLDYTSEGSDWNSANGVFARCSYGQGRFSNLNVSSWDSGGVTISKTKNNASPASTVRYKIIFIG
tara:strand:- start:1295 stop:1915 length:621 start_codon:yes stop_codon:yes gene_type:complete